jgi:hypothetical protein
MGFVYGLKPLTPGCQGFLSFNTCSYTFRFYKRINLYNHNLFENLIIFISFLIQLNFNLIKKGALLCTNTDNSNEVDTDGMKIQIGKDYWMESIDSFLESKDER